MKHALPSGHRIWFYFCGLSLCFLLGTRFLHYAVISLPAEWDHWLGKLLSQQFHSFVIIWSVVSVWGVYLAGILVTTLVIFRKKLIHKENGLWSTHPWFHSLIWLGLVFNHFLLDINPFLALVCAVSLPMLFPEFWKSLKRRWFSNISDPENEKTSLVSYGFGRAIWLFVLLAGLMFTNDFADRLALLLWVGLYLVFYYGGIRFIQVKDRLWLGIAALVIPQFAAAFIPLLLPFHGGIFLGKGMAYSFCESPNHNKLFAAVTGCYTMPSADEGWNSCKEGFIAEFDAKQLVWQARHQPLNDDFYGRMEHLMCLEDTVQVGMSGVVEKGKETLDNTLEFSISQPEQVQYNLVGSGMGHRMVHDKKHEAIFYVGEWSNQIYRYDRELKTLNKEVGNWHHREFNLFGNQLPGSMELGSQSMHYGRNSLFLVEWLRGSQVYEMDLSTLKVVHQYAHNNGGASKITVDEELNRIYIVGLWGLEVFDLETKQLIFRKRLGFVNRFPVIDAKHNLLYVPSTVTGKIYVLHRKTLDLQGTLPIGYGPRYPYMTQDGTRFITSSHQAYYYWDTANLALDFLQ